MAQEKEEPKQETIEEAALRLYPKRITDEYNPFEDLLEEERNIFIEGAKWQQEQSKNKYSEEDLKEAFEGGGKMCWSDIEQESQEPYYYDFKEWFEQFKK